MAKRYNDGFFHGPIRNRHQTKYANMFHKYSNQGKHLADSKHPFKDISMHHRNKRRH